ncbi:MAG: hypothetical protein RL322_2673 [Pseudomonadota bacterium]|jgi:hypothetical protein
MFKRVVPLDVSRHATLRVRPALDQAYARTLQRSIVMQSEIRRAAARYPIVFVEDPETDGFRPVALFGLAPGDNVFVGSDGQWRASYIPAVVRAYPFVLARSDRPDRFLVCIDEASDLVGHDEGAPLFQSDGQPDQALEEVKAFLARLRGMQLATDAFTRALAQRNLLTPFTIQAGRADSPPLQGCYVVNEERLDALPIEHLADLRARGWLSTIYAHLMSLLQIERLEPGAILGSVRPEA